MGQDAHAAEWAAEPGANGQLAARVSAGWSCVGWPRRDRTRTPPNRRRTLGQKGSWLPAFQPGGPVPGGPGGTRRARRRIGGGPWGKRAAGCPRFGRVALCRVAPAGQDAHAAEWAAEPGAKGQLAARVSAGRSCAGWPRRDRTRTPPNGRRTLGKKGSWLPAFRPGGPVPGGPGRTGRARRRMGGGTWDKKGNSLPGLRTRKCFA